MFLFTFSTLKRLLDMTRTYSEMHPTDKYSQHMIWPVWLNGWVFVYELSGWGSSPVAVTQTSDFAPASS